MPGLNGLSNYMYFTCTILFFFSVSNAFASQNAFHQTVVSFCTQAGIIIYSVKMKTLHGIIPIDNMFAFIIETLEVH